MPLRAQGGLVGDDPVERPPGQGADVAAHKDMGLQASDMNALVENLQAAMRREGIPFAAQNKLLAKLAPQKRDMMER